MKEQTTSVEERGGERYKLEKATIQIGEGHLLSVIMVDGVWLYYDITLIPGTVIKPTNIDNYLIGRLTTERKRKAEEDTKKK